MVDATPNLKALIPGITIDAVVGRQVPEGLAVMQDLASSGGLARNLVIALGTNGPFTSAELNQVLAMAAGRHFVMLTNHCTSCSWVPANNARIRAFCTPAHNCSLGDWSALADANVDWFLSDGIHMAIGGTGGQGYAELVAQGLQSQGPQTHPRLVPASVGPAVPIP
jgi:hypothetical protein